MATNIEVFNESIGYEIYFIKNSLRNLGKGACLLTRTGIVFEDHNYKEHLMNLSDSFGTNSISQYIKKNLIPLIFTSSYKIIDMFFEFIIKSNNTDCPRTFAEKCRLLRNGISSFSRPDNMGETELNLIFCLYGNFKQHRNKLIHGNWGNIENNKMVFELPNGQNEIEFEQVFAFANVSQIICKLINAEENSELIKAYVATLHREFNVLGRFMGNNFTNFEEEFVYYYNIDYNINEFEEHVHVQIIRDKIEEDLNAFRGWSPDKTCSFMYDIVVDNGTEKWCIPSCKIDNCVKMIELKKYSNYLIKEQS